MDRAAVERLALAYVGRFATTQAKLTTYLRRKVRERGWLGDGLPPLEAIVGRLADLGYVDDAAFAEARGSALTRRGFGPRRVAAALRDAGVQGEAEQEALATAEGARWESAVAFARRRRLGPFGDAAADPIKRQRQLGQMARAGHDLAVARAIITARSPEDIVAPD